MIKTVPAKTIVTRNKSTSWFGCEYNMNIYRGCSHGCIYCDSRSECYRINDFDTVLAKENALQIIRDDLRRKVKYGVIATGSMSDPYNPFEKEEKLTRNALELVNAYGFGISIATKSTLVTRDIDILSDIKQNNPVIVQITITTADDELCRIIEPNTETSSQRFNAIKTLSDEGIYCGVLLMPLLPFINDGLENVLSIVEMAKRNNAKFIYPAFGVTLRDRQREYFYNKLDENFPGIKEKYIKTFRNRYSCSIKNSEKTYKAFSEKCDEYGILYNMKDIIRSYRIGYETVQLVITE